MLYYSASNIKGKKQKKNSDLNKSSSSKLNSLYNQLDKSTNDSELNYHNNHNHNNNKSNDDSNLVNKNFINNNNQSTSIFSPHNSVFQALQNPDLNIGFDLNKINNNIIDNGNNDDNESEIDNDNDHYKNNEFSITSWQSISDEQHLDSNSINLPYQFSSNNNSNIISTNNSPFLKYSEFHNYDNISNSITNITSSNSPNRNNSPNVASILSSSSDHDYQNLTDNSNNQNDVDIEITNNGYNDESIIKLTRDALISSGIAILDLDCDSVTDDDEYTVDSSTIIPSFVMPRVSIPSILKMDYSKSTNMVNNNNSINIQVIGYNSEILINRFKCYKKTLRNINFYNKIQNNIDINLSLLIVTEENFLLPKLTKIPCIPIVFRNQSDAINSESYLQKIPKHLMVCKPIILESSNDDLMVLIDFLSNINNNIISWNKLLNDIEFDASLNLNSLNSILIEKNSLIENSSIFSNSMNKSSILNRKFENDNDSNNKKDDGFLKTKLIAGLTIGILSLTVIIVWKNLSTVKSNNNSIEFQSKSNKNNFVISLSKNNLVSETESYNSALTFDQLVFLKLKSLTEKLESWSKLLLSSSLMIIERTKLTLVQLISLSN